jgi:isoleucyl-tRNA synthetase
MLNYSELQEIDKWALFELQKLRVKITSYYESYSFHRVFQHLYSFCTEELSSFYLDVLKDRLYVSHALSLERRSAQTAIYEIIRVLVRLMAPILVYTAEEIKRHLPGDEDLVSIFLCQWPKEKEAWRLTHDKELKWIELRNLRKVILERLEQAREKKIIGNSLEARLILYPEDSSDSLFAKYNYIFAQVFIVSQIEIPERDFKGEWSQYSGYSSSGESIEKRVKIKVEQARGEKCRRCWKWSEEVGNDKVHPSLCPWCVEVIKQGEAIKK